MHVNNGTANIDADMFILYNQIKSVPGFMIEPYYFLYSNRYNSSGQPGAGSRHAEALESNPSQRRKPDRDAQGQL